MKASDIPARFPEPFAKNAAGSYKRAIPTTTVDPVAASLDLGFPPNTFVPVGAGGTPVDGRDVNGILNQTTAWSQWQNAGGPVGYDAAFSTAIGGYPKGALLTAAQLGLVWISIADDNTTNPDSGGANWLAFNRIRLSANADFYVATTGNDANNGSSGSPWATLQHAWNVLESLYDLNGFSVTLHVAAGTYTSGVTCNGPLVGQFSSSQVTFLGDAVTPANVIISATSSQCFTVQYGAMVVVNGFRLKTTTGGECLFAEFGGHIDFLNIDFNVCASNHIRAESNSDIEAAGNYSISGGAAAHVAIQSPCNVNISNVAAITLTGTPAFSTAFAAVKNCGLFSAIGDVFVGGATGQRYLATVNGVINTNGAGATYLPGSVPGSTATGGQYV